MTGLTHGFLASESRLQAEASRGLEPERWSRHPHLQAAQGFRLKPVLWRGPLVPCARNPAHSWQRIPNIEPRRLLSRGRHGIMNDEVHSRRSQRDATGVASYRLPATQDVRRGRVRSTASRCTSGQSRHCNSVNRPGSLSYPNGRTDCVLCHRHSPLWFWLVQVGEDCAACAPHVRHLVGASTTRICV